MWGRHSTRRAVPPNHALASGRVAEFIRAVDMTSPFAFRPTATLIDLIDQAEFLWREVLSIERTLSNSRTHRYGRVDNFWITHPGYVLTKELLWGVLVDNDIHIAGKNAELKGIKQKQIEVMERLRTLWPEETERWRQGVVRLKPAGWGELEKIRQKEEWYWRVERIGVRLQELLGIKEW